MRRLFDIAFVVIGVACLVVGVALGTESAGTVSGFWDAARGWAPAALILVGIWRFLTAFDRNWGIIGAIAVAAVGVGILVVTSDVLGDETVDELLPPVSVFIGLGLLFWILLNDRGFSDRSDVRVVAALGRRRLKLVSEDLRSVKTYVLLGRLDLDLSEALPSHSGVAIETWVVAGHLDIQIGGSLQPVLRTIRSGGRSGSSSQQPLVAVDEGLAVVTIDEVLVGGDTTVSTAS